MQISHAAPRPSLWLLLRLWSGIGLQSFGGGASTTLLIQQTFIEKYQWMTIDDFTHDWGLCIFTPGINLLSLTILIGRRLGGIPGIVVSLGGMLLPSATVTYLLAMGFKQIQQIPAVEAILHGVIPATAGMMLLVGLNMALPQLKQSHSEGRASMGASLGLICLSAFLILTLHISVIFVLLGAAALGTLLFRAQRSPSINQQIEEEQAHD